MKNSTRKVLLGAATLAAISGVAHDAYAAKDNLTINAKILQRIAVTATQDLDCGSMTVAKSTAGTMLVKADGSATAGGGVSAMGSNAQQGQFKVVAAKDAKLEVTLPATAKIAHTTAGTKTMVVKSFLISSAKALAATPFKITFTGGATATTGVKVGGTLQVGANQATGTYTGTALLTVVYQ